VRLVLRGDVISANAKSGYQARPHLMLYILHEPLSPTAGEAPLVRRMLLTSANLSAAPWGYARDGALEIRNFELGVSVAPERPLELVEPLVTPHDMRSRDIWRAWAQAIPFEIGRSEPLADPYVSRALTYVEGRAEKGHLNY